MERLFSVLHIKRTLYSFIEIMGVVLQSRKMEIFVLERSSHSYNYIIHFYIFIRPPSKGGSAGGARPPAKLECFSATRTKGRRPPSFGGSAGVCFAERSELLCRCQASSKAGVLGVCIWLCQCRPRCDPHWLCQMRTH